MTKIDLEFAALHSPLFFGSKSFGDKLDVYKHQGLAMQWDTEAKELTARWNGMETTLPHTSVNNYVSMGKGIRRPDSVKPITMGKIEAQVSTPQSHVFAGQGGGQTGVGKK